MLAAVSRRLPPGEDRTCLGGDRPLEPSNAAFDEDLKRRNPAWGLREVDDGAALAASHDLMLERIVEMPANNLSVVLIRR